MNYPAENIFQFLTDDYNLSFRYQSFDNYLGSNATAETYSYYNDSGCVTFMNIAVIGEESWHYSPKISDKIEELTTKEIYLEADGGKILENAEKQFSFRYRTKLRIRIQAYKDVFEHEFAQKGELFGVKVSRKH